MKRYFLVDQENVGRTFLKDIDTLTEEDVVILYHNTIHGTIAPELITALDRCRARYRVTELFNYSSQAMDFCMMAELGSLISLESTAAEYYIVSNDKGFEVAADFARTLNKEIKVARTASLDTMKETMTQAELKKEIADRLPELNAKTRSITQRCLSRALNQKDYHKKLQKSIYANLVKEVYARTKDLVSA